jgi:hypothetical protein
LIDDAAQVAGDDETIWGPEPRGSQTHGIGKTWVSELRIAMRMVICKDAELIPFGEMRAPEVLVAAEALVPAALLRAALRAAGPPLVTEPRPHRTPVGMAMIRNGRASPLVRGNAVPTGRHAERGTMEHCARALIA